MSQLEQVVRSKEEQAILEDFKGRTRVHLNKPIMINRYFKQLTDKGLTLDKDAFIKAFINLEELGHGKVHKTRYGTYRSFVPNKSIKRIGLMLLNAPKPKQAEPKVTPITLPIQSQPNEEIVVLFKLRGLTCRAYLPKDALDEFELRMTM